MIHLPIDVQYLTCSFLLIKDIYNLIFSNKYLYSNRIYFVLQVKTTLSIKWLTWLEHQYFQSSYNKQLWIVLYKKFWYNEMNNEKNNKKNFFIQDCFFNNKINISSTAAELLYTILKNRIEKCQQLIKEKNPHHLFLCQNLICHLKRQYQESVRIALITSRSQPMHV